MRAFEVHLNKKKLCLAGIGENGVLTAIVDYASGNGRDEIALTVGGLFSLQDEHVRWVKRRKLRVGDKILVKVVDTESVDKPTERRRRDLAAERRDQKRYVREMAKRLGWIVITRKPKKNREGRA